MACSSGVRRFSDGSDTGGFELPRELEGEDRLVFQDVLDRCVLAGIRTMEPIILGIEAMGPDDRRRCLDACRRRAGLKAASDLDRAEAFEMTQHLARRRTPSEEQPRLTPGGAIEIPLSEAELAALERKDRLAEERIAQRREDREREAAREGGSRGGSR